MGYVFKGSRLGVLLMFCLYFTKFQPRVAYKIVAYKKNVCTRNTYTGLLNTENYLEKLDVHHLEIEWEDIRTFLESKDSAKNTAAQK